MQRISSVSDAWSELGLQKFGAAVQNMSPSSGDALRIPVAVVGKHGGDVPEILSDKLFDVEVFLGIRLQTQWKTWIFIISFCTSSDPRNCGVW